MRTMRTVSAVIDTRWSQGASPRTRIQRIPSAPPGYQDYPQNEWYTLVAFEQTKFPVVVQDLDQRNPLAVKRLLSVRGRLEVLDRLHEFVGQSLRVRASSALTASSQQGPLLLRHDPSVGPAEFLYPMTFRFGELSCELVKIAYRVGFVVGCPLCLPEFAPHDEQRKSERQRVHDVERRIDRTDGGVVRYSQRQGQVTLYENLSHE